MPVTASRLFDFLDDRPSRSIERYAIASAAFGDLRHSLRFMIVNLVGDATGISDRLRSLLSEWLTVPVRFDNTVLLALREMGGPAAVESRWGRDIRSHYDDACRTAQELMELENPVRATLANVIQTLCGDGRSFRIFCHRRSREHFESLFPAANGAALHGSVFIHSVAEYREAELFDTLLKVGPLRSRGWGSAPDALLTAPRFDTLIQVVWSGCGDEPGFGYDPVSESLPAGDTAPDPGAVADWCAPGLQLKWEVQETRSRDNTIRLHGDLPDINEFEVFTKLAQPTDAQRSTLVQVDDCHGILYPPHSWVLGLDTVTNSIDYRLPGESLEGMFLILPVVNDARLAGPQAENGNFSRIWKEKLKAEYQRDPAALASRLRDAGLQLLFLQGCIERWCRPPSTVIHAPQSMHHFEILIEVLGLDFGPNEPARRRGATWWQFAWDEIRRARGEAIQTGFQEQQAVDEQALVALRALDSDIRANLGHQAFHLPIPAGEWLEGEFRFYKVLAVEEGLMAPADELKKLCGLERIDQWRV